MYPSPSNVWLISMGLGNPCLSVLLSHRPFALDDLDDYEKHFTVMNYDPDVVLKQVGPGGAQEQGSGYHSWVLERQGSLAPRRVRGMRSL